MRDSGRSATRVVFDGVQQQVVALDGVRVRLSDGDDVKVVLLAHLVDSPGFEVLEGRGNAVVGGVVADLLDDVPPQAAARARLWERHLVELETGLPAGALPGSVARPEYDPALPLVQREISKAAELSGLLGGQVTWRAVRRNRHRYLHGGVRALVDGRLIRRSSPTGRVDPRVVEAVREALAGERDRSTGTRDRLRFQVERAVRDRYGAEAPPVPSKATFNRLVAGLDVGRHSFGSAITRRSQAAKPQGLYTVGLAARPGQQVHIDSTPFDVLAMFDSTGSPGAVNWWPRSSTWPRARSARRCCARSASRRWTPRLIAGPHAGARARCARRWSEAAACTASLPSIPHPPGDRRARMNGAAG